SGQSFGVDIDHNFAAAVDVACKTLESALGIRGMLQNTEAEHLVESLPLEGDAKNIALEQAQPVEASVAGRIGLDRTGKIERVHERTRGQEHFGESTGSRAGLQNLLPVQPFRPAGGEEQPLARNRPPGSAVELCATMKIPLHAERGSVVLH